MNFKEIITSDNIQLTGGILALIGTAIGLYYTYRSNDKMNKNRMEHKRYGNQAFYLVGEIWKVINSFNTPIDSPRKRFDSGISNSIGGQVNYPYLNFVTSFTEKLI